MRASAPFYSGTQVRNIFPGENAGASARNLAYAVLALAVVDSSSKSAPGTQYPVAGKLITLRGGSDTTHGAGSSGAAVSTSVMSITCRTEGQGSDMMASARSVHRSSGRWFFSRALLLLPIKVVEMLLLRAVACS